MDFFVQHLLEIAGTITAILIGWLTFRSRSVTQELLVHELLFSRDWHIKRKLATMEAEFKVSLVDELEDRLRLEYNGQSVDELYILVIRLHNSGTEAIEEEDYDWPIRLIFDERAQVVEALARRTSGVPSENLATFSRSTVELKPVLINPSQSILVTIVANSAVMTPVVEGNLRGTRGISDPHFGEVITMVLLKWSLRFLAISAGIVFVGAVIGGNFGEKPLGTSIMDAGGSCFKWAFRALVASGIMVIILMTYTYRHLGKEACWRKLRRLNKFKVFRGGTEDTV